MKSIATTCSGLPNLTESLPNLTACEMDIHAELAASLFPDTATYDVLYGRGKTKRYWLHEVAQKQSDVRFVFHDDEMCVHTESQMALTWFGRGTAATFDTKK